MLYRRHTFTGGYSAVEVERRYRDFDESTVRRLLGDRADQRLLRAVYFEPPPDLVVLRVRSEQSPGAHTAAIAVKDRTKPYPVETELPIPTLEEGVDLLQKMGHKQLRTIEKIREIYNYKGTEVVFDHMPGLPPYIEIEAPDEITLDAAQEALGLRVEPPFGPAQLYQAEYDTQRGDLSLATFAGGHPVKNKQLYEERLSAQLAQFSELFQTTSRSIS